MNRRIKQRQRQSRSIRAMQQNNEKPQVLETLEDIELSPNCIKTCAHEWEFNERASDHLYDVYDCKHCNEIKCIKE
ncbi:hypothetical protein MSC38_01135 [Acinetobacter baumannii]|uniref:hypothetical protein n=1 Tax=Acinetobacter baumannii TaxID=470 RepID=UPI0022B363BA|nr:hypothetical protein [Acinetobacter baumannii]MDN8180440.1 hypothetical protein [Acinetobacter baumannii]MDV4226911.1 hypothetical protein [Acinetobacter baumannii]